MASDHQGGGTREPKTGPITSNEFRRKLGRLKDGGQGATAETRARLFKRAPGRSAATGSKGMTRAYARHLRQVRFGTRNVPTVG